MKYHILKPITAHAFRNSTISTGRPKSFDTPLCFVAGWLWNWNMVTTPMLLSLSGIFRVRAVYYPHDSSFVTTKAFVCLSRVLGAPKGFSLHANDSLHLHLQLQHINDSFVFQAIIICSVVFLYGSVFASFPFFFDSINYFYFEW